MRQAGIVAAAGVYALDNCVERLADDHRNAKKIGHGKSYDSARLLSQYWRNVQYITKLKK